MAEPITTSAVTATAATRVGLAALLVGAFGAIGADVMMVILSAIAGCFIALSNDKPVKTLLPSIFFIIKGIVISLVLAWAVSSVASTVIPALDTPYAPAIVAFCIGFLGDSLPKVIGDILKKTGIKK